VDDGRDRDPVVTIRGGTVGHRASQQFSDRRYRAVVANQRQPPDASLPPMWMVNGDYALKVMLDFEHQDGCSALFWDIQRGPEHCAFERIGVNRGAFFVR